MSLTVGLSALPVAAILTWILTRPEGTSIELVDTGAASAIQWAVGLVVLLTVIAIPTYRALAGRLGIAIDAHEVAL